MRADMPSYAWKASMLPWVDIMRDFTNLRSWPIQPGHFSSLGIGIDEVVWNEKKGIFIKS